jgi:hypothetical protein
LRPRGLRDGHTERSFAHARRPDEAQDGAFRILDQLADGKKLKDALLDLFEAVVILIENLFSEIN